MFIGHVRISAIDLQRDALTRAECEKPFQEKLYSMAESKYLESEWTLASDPSLQKFLRTIKLKTALRQTLTIDKLQRSMT